MKVLVTGAGGMVGQAVVGAAAGAGYEVVALTRADLDITDADAVRRVVVDARPDAVINCAAWTDVDGAEGAEADARELNSDAAGYVTEAAVAAGAHMVHISTDYVFGGDATAPYLESSHVAAPPRTAYGRTKLAGEWAVRAVSPRAAIVRTAWVFGPGGKNFVDTMRRLAVQRDAVSVVDDQRGSPTYTGHLAAALVEVASQGLGGVMHVAGGGDCTWFDLAAATFEATDADVALSATDSASFAAAAPRPAYSVLETERDDAPRLPPWQDGLAAHLEATKEAAT